MRLIGLTGGVGMGKSACADLLAQMGIPVVDTDRFAHLLTQRDQPALHEIVGCFGPQILDASGQLQRGALARIVFDDPVARGRLEAILHPRIAQAWKDQAREWRNKGVKLGVVMIPLLFETHAAAEFDATVCVACQPETQKKRLAARGWTDVESAGRVAAQMPIDQKMAQSDYVIWSEGELSVLADQVRRVFSAGNPQ